ncbi:hypothetical protein LCGC14_0516640 [marine sediment metagenome]|uniref:Uncharacterized protein n=1 Tax=marine sediment metagenome TaxID=412755 RepID=A0A0F9ULB6_9ZZZZ
MSLLDKLDSEKYKPENRGHPSEGMLHRDTFTIIEGGSSHSYAVKQYPGVTMEILKSGQKLSGEVVLTEGEFEMCYSIYNIQADVYLGRSTQEELDEAVANVQSNQAAQQQTQQQAQQQGGAQTAPAPGSQPQPSPAAPNKASLQDVAKILVNDIDGALGKPVYQITSELAEEVEKKGFEICKEEDFYPLVEGWKNGVIKVEQDGSFDESLLKIDEDEEDEEEE